MSDTAVVIKAEPATVDAGQLIAQAIDKNLPIESMERLLAMRRELKAEAAKEAFFRALSNFQSECPEIPKTKTVMNKDGKTVRYKYAPLETIISAVKTPLKDNGFSYTVKTEQDNGSVTAICRLHHIDGHTEDTQLTVPIDKGSYMSAPQQIAAALTYAKRYAFCDATGIMTADEDTDAQPENGKQENTKTENGNASDIIRRLQKSSLSDDVKMALEKQYWSKPDGAKPVFAKQVIEPKINNAPPAEPPEPDDHADEVEGTVEDDPEWKPEEDKQQDLPIEGDKVVLGKEPDKEIF